MARGSQRREGARRGRRAIGRCAADSVRVVVDELGHFPVKANCQQAQQKTTEQGDENRLFVGHVQVSAKQKAPRGRK